MAITKMGAKQTIVGAMSGHPGTPQAKAKARTRKAKGNQAGSLDDAGQAQEADAETDPLELGVFDALPVELGPMEQRVCGINKYKESGNAKFSLDTGAAITAFPFGSC